MADNSQEQTSTPTPEATTPAATVLTPQPQTTAPATSADKPAETTAKVDAPTEDGEDLSWVPAKFLRDGKPDFQNLAKSYQSLEKKIGQKGNFAPESIEAYEYTPKSITLDEEANKAFKEDALQAGLTPKQYQWALEQYEKAYEQTTDTPEKAKAYLEKQWGKDYEKNVQQAIKAFETYVPSHIPIEVIGNNPFVIDILSRIGGELGEDVTPVRSSAGATGQSKEDITKLMGEPDYWKNAKKQAQVSEWYAKNAK